ncbi:unnamed protein product, partial [Iphiclides podalirius]
MSELLHRNVIILFILLCCLIPSSFQECSNIFCSNVFDEVCGFARSVDGTRLFKKFHNYCHLQKIKCKLKSIIDINQVPDKFCNIRKKTRYISGSGRRVHDFSIVGAHQACNHTCPTFCVDTYEPACAQIWKGNMDSYDYRPMINHCHIDLFSCALGVNVTIQPLGFHLCPTQNMSQRRKWEPLKKVGIIGVPFEKGQKKYGVSVAPAAIRAAGLIEHLNSIVGLDVKDYGDIDTSAPDAEVNVHNMAHLSQVSSCNKKLSARVSQVLKDGRVAVTIGGDHSVGVGTVDGHFNVNEDMILIWVDAHADINTNKTSGSGSVHGMPVALLVKELSDYWPYLPTMDWQVPKFSIKNLGYVGLRSVDEYERLAIEKYNVPTFAMEDIDEHGIRKSINHILQVLDPEMNKPIHVSFDIDSLDALEAPSTGTPVRGGLSLREAINLMEIIHSTGRLRAVDLVEINPALGDESDRKRTIEAGLCVLKASLGFSRRGTAPRGVLDLPVQTHH